MFFFFINNPEAWSWFAILKQIPGPLIGVIIGLMAIPVKDWLSKKKKEREALSQLINELELNILILNDFESELQKYKESIPNHFHNGSIIPLNPFIESMAGFSNEKYMYCQKQNYVSNLLSIECIKKAYFAFEKQKIIEPKVQEAIEHVRSFFYQNIDKQEIIEEKYLTNLQFLELRISFFIEQVNGIKTMLHELKISLKDKTPL
jgi:hypothetical protein